MFNWRYSLAVLTALLAFIGVWFWVSHLRASGHLVRPGEATITMPWSDRVNGRFAVAMCHERVRIRLETPNVSFARPWNFRTYSPPLRVDNTWRYTMTVDAENLFGAMNREKLVCVVDGDDGTTRVTRANY